MRKEKQLLLDEIKDKLDSTESFILMNYEKISANAANEFRTCLFNVGGDWEVVRKRVLMKALKERGLEVDEKTLEGHIGLVLAKDSPVEAAKSIFQYSKEHGVTINVLGGFIDGKMYAAKDVETLSKLPGKDEMRAQLLGLLEAPLSGTLATMEALLTSVCHCLQNKGDADNA